MPTTMFSPSASSTKTPAFEKPDSQTSCLWKALNGGRVGDDRQRREDQAPSRSAIVIE